jgi:TolB-like protein
MTADRAFLLPLVIENTSDSDDRVPDKYREVQWTRLPAGQAPPAFVERVSRLLSQDEPKALAPDRTTVGRTRVVRYGRANPGPAPTAVSANSSASWWSRAALLVIAVGVVSGVGYFAVNRFVASQRFTQAGPTAAPARQTDSAEPGTIPEKSIAVLPFVDMSEKRVQEYFSDGLSEELLNLLAQVPDLRVSARSSSFYFKGKSEDVAIIARKLRVAHVLEGSVRKAGSTIRVTAQLIRADSGYHLLSKTYDRDFRDIFKVQDEIAAAVVDALKAQLPPAQQISSRYRTENIEAYTEYLLGKQFRARDTPEANRQALAAYRKAVALDPGYAPAYSGLADAEWRVTDQSTSEAAAYERAAVAADKAIALAPNSPDGYWARGRLRNNYYFDWHGAEVDDQKALALDANYVPAQVECAALLGTLGRSADAVAPLRKALALDPLSIPAWHVLVKQLTDRGEFTEARLAARGLAEVDPDGDDDQLGGYIDLFDGRAREALTAFRAGRLPHRLIGTALAEHTLGHAAESQRALDQIIEKQGNTLAYQIAEIYAWRVEFDKAFQWLERAYRQHDGGLGYVTHDRCLAKLRGDARYQALIRKLKLTA